MIAAPAQEFIFAISVPGLFFLNPTTQAYDSKSGSMVGCVIVGSSASYNLMFYDSNKQTLFVTPVSPTVSVSSRLAHWQVHCLSHAHSLYPVPTKYSSRSNYKLVAKART